MPMEKLVLIASKLTERINANKTQFNPTYAYKYTTQANFHKLVVVDSYWSSKVAKLF